MKTENSEPQRTDDVQRARKMMHQTHRMDEIQYQLCMAAGGVRGLGNIMAASLGGLYDDTLDKGDLEAVSCAVEALGHHLERLAGELSTMQFGPPH